MLLDRNLIKSAFVLIALNNDTIAEDKTILRSLGLDFKLVEGVYNGVAENSYRVKFSNVEQLADLARIAKTHDQESILIVDQERNAKLVYLDGRVDDRVELGTFQNVSELEAKQATSYTYEVDKGYYYLAK